MHGNKILGHCVMLLTKITAKSISALVVPVSAIECFHVNQN